MSARGPVARRLGRLEESRRDEEDRRPPPSVLRVDTRPPHESVLTGGARHETMARSENTCVTAAQDGRDANLQLDDAKKRLAMMIGPAATDTD